MGHPLLEHETKDKIDLSNIISNDKKFISLFSGSRSSEVNLLLPILIDFINMMNAKFDNLTFVFHATDGNKNLIGEKINYVKLKNVEVVSDENIKKLFHIDRKFGNNEEIKTNVSKPIKTDVKTNISLEVRN